MIDTCEINEQTVFSLCKQHLESYNLIIKFPKNTPPHLSYQWRYIKSITKKFIEWDFTITEVDAFINAAVDKSKTNFNIKGLSLLYDNDVLDHCYKLAKQNDETTNQEIRAIHNMHRWLNTQIGNGDAVTHLLSKSKPGAFCNIVTYYESNKLNTLFLACSKACFKSLSIISSNYPNERRLCPSLIELYSARRFQYTDLMPQISAILGSDFHV